MNDELEYISIKPGKALSDFVENIWLLHNKASYKREIVIVPDGRVDIFFYHSANQNIRAVVFGLESEPQQTQLNARTSIFAVSLKPLGAEYILKQSIAGILNDVKLLPQNFWEITKTDLQDFEHFHKKINKKLSELMPSKTDERKLQLFNLIYSSNCSLTVKELSERVFWSSRQINRYFNKQYGITLKAYCNILRFRATFLEIKEGRLFPGEAFADQAHFIKESRKMAGVSPKVIRKDKNDRFIQFSKFSQK